MATARWNGAIIAQSNDTVMVEGNHYFPMSSVNREYLTENSKTSRCFWKGTANYFNIEVDGQVNSAAAWYYAEPMEKAANIKDHVAFWGGVKVTE